MKGCPITPIVRALLAGLCMNGILPLAGLASAPELAHGSEHPRLFFRSEDLTRMRTAIESVPMAKERYADLVRTTNAEAAIAYPIPSSHTNREWQPVAYRMAENAAKCGVLFQMTGDERYGRWAKAFLLDWAAKFDTRVNYKLVDDYYGTEVGAAGEGGNTMGYYFSGDVLTKLSLAYDCLYHEFTAAERERIEQDLFLSWVEEIEAYDHSRRRPGYAPDFMTGPGSWNGANKCNMGLTAVGFALNIPRLYERGVQNFKTVVARDMLADGFWLEEDRNYADGCMATFFSIAWMARSSGYPTDLFNLTLHRKANEEYDQTYIEVLPEPDGPVPPERNIRMYLDAHLDWQYPDFGPGNWGWYPDRGNLGGRYLTGMYVIGNAIYDDPEYAFILQQIDPSKGSVSPAGLDPIYFAEEIESVPPTDTGSRWYPHGKWAVLKSIEGPEYWNSDALYAFMPYGHERTKGLQPLSLDIYGFGEVLAPRINLTGWAQNLTKSYQLNEPAWNTVMVDGNILDTFRGDITESTVSYHDFTDEIKVLSAQVHVLGVRRTELAMPYVERHRGEDRVHSRTLALTDVYLVDVFRITYDREPLYKHNFDYVLHGYGKLTLEGKVGQIAQTGDVTAVWEQENGVGLRSTVLSAAQRGGTKFDWYANERTEFFVATRANFEDWFVVVHEPVKGDSRIASIESIAEQDDAVVLCITLKDGTVDYLALRTKLSDAVYRWDLGNGESILLDGNYQYQRLKP